jgi:pimeloyl-ACP methyl ester carboxylesterase
VSYDRAGLGWSEPTARRHDGAEIAAQLYELLRAADVPGPYILVGHSLGGVFVRVFADRYPRDAAGMVLVDAANPRQLELPNFRDLIHQTRSLFTSQLWENPDLVRAVTEQSTIGLPARQVAEAAILFGSSRHVTAAAAELAEIEATVAQALRARPLGDLRLIVLTAGSIPAEMDGWLALQAELVGLSARATQEIVPGAAHLTLVTERRFAMTVTAAIRRLVETVRIEGMNP